MLFSVLYCVDGVPRGGVVGWGGYMAGKKTYLRAVGENPEVVWVISKGLLDSVYRAVDVLFFHAVDLDSHLVVELGKGLATQDRELATWRVKVLRLGGRGKN